MHEKRFEEVYLGVCEVGLLAAEEFLLWLIGFAITIGSRKLDCSALSGALGTVVSKFVFRF